MLNMTYQHKNLINQVKNKNDNFRYSYNIKFFKTILIL